ncbi:acetyltransferase [Acidisarcina polymorpha]|uniref:acetyltransferase n=1 Tax=Acidisarcina polymorpha TaxID=2211140 RepID=UPI000DEFD706|nr:acetyltransferase [Acidisarcina polymorpha]
MTRLSLRFATPKDYSSIIALQRTRYINNLSESERRKGFLSVEMTLQDIDTYANDLGIVIACEDTDLLGYFCVSRTRHWMGNSIINALLSSLHRSFEDNGIVDPGLETCLFGPVCLSGKARGKNVFQRLHAVACRAASREFAFAISFIAANNVPSITAARGVDTHPAAQFSMEQGKYHSYFIDLSLYRAPLSLGPEHHQSESSANLS